MIISILAFQAKDERNMRALAAVSMLPWFPYAFRVGSTSTLAAVSLYVSGQLAQLVRLRRAASKSGAASEACLVC